MNAIERSEIIEANLLSELGNKPESFTYLIPEWEPEKMVVGIRWLKSSVWEGFSVAFKIDYEAKLVYLKNWEDDEEPNWNELVFKT